MTAALAALPADTGPELRRVVDQLWGRDGIEAVPGPVVPDGMRLVDQFVVVPSFQAARMLLPARSARARYGALAHYNGLRRGVRRHARTGLAVGARTGLDRLVTRDVLSICVSADRVPADDVEVSFTTWLERRLGHGPLHSAIGVSNPSPSRKSTIQLFRPDGRPAAYVKVGGNALTTSMVTNEAGALRRLEASGLQHPRRPRVLLFDTWHGLTALASEPMPLSVRGHSETDCPPIDLGPSPAGATPYRATFTSRLDDLVRRDGVTRAEADTLLAATIPAAAALGEEIVTAPWHGDWVAWNLADRRDELWAWDWEYFAESAPVGFDLLNFHFQQQFTPAGQPLEAAMAVADRQLRGDRRAQLRPGVAQRITGAYLAELYVRAAHMSAEGAGWDLRFREPAMRWLTDHAGER